MTLPHFPLKSTPSDRIYGITNMKSYVPLLLDLDRLNYDSWKELFKTHCMGYKVYHHLTRGSSSTNDPEWETVDNIVKQWIYGTLTQSVLQVIIKPDGIAKEVWDSIENLLHKKKKTEDY